MAERDFVFFALVAFAIVKGLELRVMPTGAEGGLEEAGAQHFDSAVLRVPPGAIGSVKHALGAAAGLRCRASPAEMDFTTSFDCAQA